jgi:formylglycine-generating enzyme required for sulfatase activity
MGKYQVTQEQYFAVMGVNPSVAPHLTNPIEDDLQGMRPVDNVNWYAALVFCNLLSMRENLAPAYQINGSTDPAAWGSVPLVSDSTWNAVEIVSGSTGFRLPTEAQWEFAAKGGTRQDPFTFSGSNVAAEVAHHGISAANGGATREVGKLASNGLGIYDMSGNVWEMCWDLFGDYTNLAKTDPTGASSGLNRVTRGGNWQQAASLARVVHRDSRHPASRGNLHGFRVVRP